MIPSPLSFRTPVSPQRFFTLTFILSWLVWIPLVLAHFEILFHIPENISAIVRLLGVLMPAASALILTRTSGQKRAVRQVIARLTIWRVGWKWWGAAVLVYPILLALSAFFYNLFSLTPVEPVPQDIATLITNILFLLIAVLGEEIGWHGVALPSLQQRYTPWISSLILGICWGIWHVPFWLLLDTFTQFGVFYLVLNLLFVLPLTFYSTWFFNHSRYSLLLPVVFHLVFNVVNTAILPTTLKPGAFALLIAFSWILMFIILPGLQAATKEKKPGLFIG